MDKSKNLVIFKLDRSRCYPVTSSRVLFSAIYFFLFFRSADFSRRRHPSRIKVYDGDLKGKWVTDRIIWENNVVLTLTLRAVDIDRSFALGPRKEIGAACPRALLNSSQRKFLLLVSMMLDLWFRLKIDKMFAAGVAHRRDSEFVVAQFDPPDESLTWASARARRVIFVRYSRPVASSLLFDAAGSLHFFLSLLLYRRARETESIARSIAALKWLHTYSNIKGVRKITPKNSWTM